MDKEKYHDELLWQKCHSDDLWIFDKLILSKKLNYVCGPHGLEVPKPDFYIVRPCVNLMGMGRSAKFMWIEKNTYNLIPDGTFWCEIFKGRHLSIDYADGEQILCVEGIRKTDDPIWKWSEWKKTEDVIPMPNILKTLKGTYRYFNVEMIDDKIIEIHLRLNPDWASGDWESIIPVFEGDNIQPPDGYNFREDRDFKRLGFFVK